MEKKNEKTKKNEKNQKNKKTKNCECNIKMRFKNNLNSMSRADCDRERPCVQPKSKRIPTKNQQITKFRNIFSCQNNLFKKVF